MAEETDEEIVKVQNFIKSQVQEAMKEFQVAEKPVTRETTPDDGNKQLREVLDPFFKPDINQTRLETMAVQDESRFYRKHQDASEYEDQIEAVFSESMKRGQPMRREDIHKYIVGKEALENPEKFDEKRTAKKQQQIDVARTGVDMGYSGAGREKETSTFKNFDKLSTEDMEKALEGVTF